MAIERYDAREQALGEELMGALERFLLLQTIDERWREHLFDMDYLREGIHLRGLRPDRPAGRLQERGLHAVRRPDEQRLVGLRADDLQRPGQRRGRERRRRRRAAVVRGRGQLDARRAGLLLGRPQRRRRGRAGRGRRGRGRSTAPRATRATAKSSKPCPSSSSGCSTTSTRWAQRPLLVRQRQEVQEVPRRVRREAPRPRDERD